VPVASPLTLVGGARAPSGVGRAVLRAEQVRDHLKALDEWPVVRLPTSHRDAANSYIRAIVDHDLDPTAGPPAWRVEMLWDRFVIAYAGLAADGSLSERDRLERALARL
jgi:hypothetical protein